MILVANVFWTRLKLICPIFSLEISKMSKKGVLAKISKRKRVITTVNLFRPEIDVFGLWRCVKWTLLVFK